MTSSIDETQGVGDTPDQATQQTEENDSDASEFPALDGSDIPVSGPEISGNDLIGGHTGIAGTGATTEASDEARHPGGTPTV